MSNEVEALPVTADNSTLYLGLGCGLGAYAAVTAVLAGFVCPTCAVAAPALIATGAYQKIRNRKRKPDSAAKGLLRPMSPVPSMAFSERQTRREPS